MLAQCQLAWCQVGFSQCWHGAKWFPVSTGTVPMGFSPVLARCQVFPQRSALIALIALIGVWGFVSLIFVLKVALKRAVHGFFYFKNVRLHTQVLLYTRVSHDLRL